MRAEGLLQQLQDTLPEQVGARLRQDWARIVDAAHQAGVQWLGDAGMYGQMFRALIGSDFVAQYAARQPAAWGTLLASGDLQRAYHPDEYRQRIWGVLNEVTDDAALARALRRLRQREMVRIAWRDIAATAAIDETLAELSALADACIDGTLQHLYQRQCNEQGVPTGAGSGAPQQLVVLGMGKLGAGELNYSSDIDLIFAFPEHGDTVSGGRSVSNEAFFLRLSQRLIRALSEQTADGFVFRVDMRLRPYGDSGPLAASFDFIEDYYQSQGRDWERYAMVKARPVAGDAAAGARLMDLLRPFVYRRYLDYGSFEALRDMKALINREVLRKGLADNVKLGPGGIREIEFIGQAFQLIRGGRELALQVRPIKQVLRHLAGDGLLPGYAVEGLLCAYDFLRRTENHIQNYADEQTHVLPEDMLQRQRLALSLGFDNWDDFLKELTRHRRFVQEQFEQVMTAPQTEPPASAAASDELAAVWLGGLEAEAAAARLIAAGLAEPAEIMRRLDGLRDSHAVRAMSARGRSRLDGLMPMLMRASSATAAPDQTLLRLLTLIEAVTRRSAYLALLIENPMALSQLVRLCAASPWIARQLTRHPVLLDELLDPRTLYAPARRAALHDELAMLRHGHDPQDLEQQMEILRYFKQANMLRVAAADVTGVLPLMVVSDHLTETAEVVVEQALELAQLQQAARGGQTAGGGHGFIVVAYGKLGGIELGYGSDLDLVFIHDGEQGDPYYPRLAQRIIHILNTQTPSGMLYEVDVRLRPSGKSGLLVSSLEAFTEYQHSEAWTWEHQALVRARVVAGDPVLAQRFDQVRAQVLSRARDAATLRTEVCDMRERMRRELARGAAGRFDLKQDRGGITDIEFLVQYAVLRHAHQQPGLLRWTDNIRLLDEMAAAGIISGDAATVLREAYCAYRACGHALTLQEQPLLIEDGRFDAQRARVQALWDQLMAGA